MLADRVRMGSNKGLKTVTIELQSDWGNFYIINPPLGDEFFDDIKNIDDIYTEVIDMRFPGLTKPVVLYDTNHLLAGLEGSMIWSVVLKINGITIPESQQKSVWTSSGEGVIYKLNTPLKDGDLVHFRFVGD